jgi:hypothetical protein
VAHRSCPFGFGHVERHFGRSWCLWFKRFDFVAWLSLALERHQRGVPGKVFGQFVGHAMVDTTLNVYTRVIDGSLRAAVDKVGSELFTVVHKPEPASELTH